MSGSFTWAEAQGAASSPVAAESVPGTFTWEEATKTPSPSASTVAGAPSSKISGMLANAGAGTAEAVANTLGAPVDLITGGLNLASRGIKAATGYDPGQITNPIGGSQSIEGLEGSIGADPRNVVPSGIGDQAARAVAGGAAAAVLPMGPARALASKATGLLGAGAEALGGGTVAGQAAVGGGAALAGTGAAAAAPKEWAPVADVAAQLAAGGGIAAVHGAAGAAADAVGSRVGTVAKMVSPLGAKPVLDSAGAPITRDDGSAITATPGRLQLVGNRLASAATDLPAAREALANPDQQIVPGSQPTTYQVTQDPGLGGEERLAQKTNMPAFLDRMANNNQARVQAIQALDPKTATPGDVGSAFQSMLDGLTDQQTADQTSHVAQVRALTEAAGASTTPEQAGRTIIGDTAEAYQPKLDQAQQAVDVAQQAATRRNAALGPDVAASSQSPLETLGAPLRAALDVNHQNAKQVANHLYSLVDPDGSLVADARPIQSAAQNILDARGPFASPLTSDESRIYGLAANSPPAIPFSDLGDLRSQLTDALRSERTSPKSSGQAVRRLSMMLDGVHSAMAQSVEGQAARDGEAVAAGQMSSDDTTAAKLFAQAQAFRQNQQPDVLAASVGRTDAQGNGASNGPSAGRVARAVPGSFGAESQAGGRYGDAPGGSPLAGGTPLTPNLDQAAIDRYANARQTDTDVHQTYENAPGVGEALRGGPTAGSFANQLSSVPHLLFGAGAGAAAKVRAGLQAGLKPQAFDQYASYSLRRYADPNQTGQLDPIKAQKWITDHSEALSVLPKLRAKFRSAAAASQALDQAKTARDAATAAYPLKDTRTAGEVAQKAFVPGPRGAETVRQTISNAGDAPSTISAIEDHAAEQLREAAMRDDGTLNSLAFDRWTKAHAGALSELPGLKSRLSDAKTAQTALEDTATANKAQIDAFHRSAAAQLVGNGDPVSTVGRILGSDRALPMMQDLAARAPAGSTARAGLQASVAEFITRELTSNLAAGKTGTEFLKSDRFQTFVKRSPAALRTIFSENQVKAIRDVAADLQRAQRSVSGTQMPGRPSTAQDIHAGEAHDAHGDLSLIGLAMIEEGGRVAEGVLGKLGALFSVGAVINRAARLAGFQRVNELAADAMLHPRLAEAALRTVTPKNVTTFLPPLLRSIRGAALRTAITPVVPAAAQQSPGTPRPTFPDVSSFAGLRAQ